MQVTPNKNKKHPRLFLLHEGAQSLGLLIKRGGCGEMPYALLRNE